jgi:hypothetical protein
MSLIRTKNPKSTKSETKKLVFSGKRLEGTWIMETQLAVPVRRSAMNANVVISDNRRVRTLH